jgi:PASTA domain-containing protein
VRRSLFISATVLVSTLGFVTSGWGAPPSKPGPPPPTGTLAICNASGARPISIPLGYTAAAAASAGGTLSFNVPVGTCSGQVFYPQGAAVTVTENVPSGYAVTGIAIGGGGSTISSMNLAAGTATVTIGSGQSVLTFTTSAPPPFTPPASCKVPNLLGLGLLGARAALKRGACTLGRVSRGYSSAIPVGRVVAAKPRRGTVLAHAAPVDIVLSRGPRA